MGKMKDMVMDIEGLLYDGLSYAEIANQLDIPVRWVVEVASAMQQYDDGMDGDAASALASAGFGTDEDYGYAGDDF